MIRLIALILPLFMLLGSQQTKAQIKLPDGFQKALDNYQLSFYQPLERSFKRIRLLKNPIQSCDFAMRSRKGGLEIRYLIRPIAPDRQAIPHIDYLAMASHLASNEEESHIAIHQIPDIQLEEQFHADWGAISYFEPKLAFSNKKHCKMLSFFVEGKAQVFVFFLFNQAVEALDQQMFSLRFEQEAQ